ncbi:MAG: hypothetical protein K9L30_15925 [Desulfobacterales bacterium]|nr:hypothetical protein [Desulfobacterales bacterium]
MKKWSTDFIEFLVKGSHGKMLLMIHYGSGQKDRDLDFFSLYDGVETTERLLIGGIDFVAISRDVLLRYLRMMDPIVTEPLLTGKIVCGNAELRDKLVSMLNSYQPTQEVIRYLISRSFQSYTEAYKIGIKKVIKDYRINRMFWSAVSYLISYWCFAKQYNCRYDSVAKLSDVVNSSSKDISALWRKVEKSKRNRLTPSLEILSEWNDIILR